jgi:hypothetical protein
MRNMHRILIGNRNADSIWYLLLEGKDILRYVLRKLSSRVRTGLIWNSVRCKAWLLWTLGAMK